MLVRLEIQPFLSISRLCAIISQAWARYFGECWYVLKYNHSCQSVGSVPLSVKLHFLTHSNQNPRLDFFTHKDFFFCKLYYFSTLFSYFFLSLLHSYSLYTTYFYWFASLLLSLLFMASSSHPPVLNGPRLASYNNPGHFVLMHIHATERGWLSLSPPTSFFLRF
jgi:hypothetical protein